MAIIFCACDNDYQDKKYGFHKRVHNATLKGKTGPTVYRCTVCGNEKQKRGGEKEDE